MRNRQSPPHGLSQGARHRHNGGLSLPSILPYLRRARRQPDGSYLACCPCHDDHEPSLHLSQSPDGTLLWHCFGGCSQEAVEQALRRLAGIDRPHRRESRPQGLTLAEYARAKQLDESRLREWGCSDTPYQGRPAIAMEYRDSAGNLVAVRYRIALTGDRFRWRNGDAPALYGLWRLPEWDTRYLILTEGESDTQTLWQANYPALGIPGAGTWQPEWWSLLEPFEKLYLLMDGDTAGEQLLQRLAQTCPESLRERVSIVRLPDGIKDVNALWCACNGTTERFRASLKELERIPLDSTIPSHTLSEMSEMSELGETALRLSPIRYADLNPEPASAIVPNLLYAGRITFLAGESGVGKTTFALELSDALESGGLLWNRLPVPQTRILWLDFDHSFERLKEIMEAYYGSRPRDMLCLPKEQLLPLDDFILPAYKELIQREGIELIIADTAFDWLGVVDDCSDAEAREKMERIRALIADTGVAVLLLHHPNKAADSSGSTRALSGSHRWAAKADVVAYLVFDAVEGRDVVKLKVVKDRDGERKEYRFERWQRRFIPLEPEGLPPSDWRVVEGHLQQYGEATYEELHHALQEAGFNLTLRALQDRIARWRRKGKVVVERRGFPAVAYVKLNAFVMNQPFSQTPQFTQFADTPCITAGTAESAGTGETTQIPQFTQFTQFTDAPCETAESGAREREAEPAQFTQFPQFTGDGGENAETAESAESAQSEAIHASAESVQFPQFTQFPQLHMGIGQNAESAPRRLQAHADPTAPLPDFDNRVPLTIPDPDPLEAFLAQATADPMGLTPEEADTVRQLWCFGEVLGFPRVAVNGIPAPFVIEQGQQAWWQAIERIAGTVNCQRALQAVVDTCRERQAPHRTEFASGSPPA